MKSSRLFCHHSISDVPAFWEIELAFAGSRPLFRPLGYQMVGGHFWHEIDGKIHTWAEISSLYVKISIRTPKCCTFSETSINLKENFRYLPKVDCVVLKKLIFVVFQYISMQNRAKSNEPFHKVSEFNFRTEHPIGILNTWLKYVR